MKRHGILNADVSRVLSYMGHKDMIAIGDCGLPIPDETERIDLAIQLGSPSFLEVLKPVSEDMKVEKIFLAEEIRDCNPDIHERILRLFSEQYPERMPEIEYITHDRLKELTASCRAVIRSGENTPYANIILQSACLF